MRLRERIAAITGRAPTRLSKLAGGCVGDVNFVEFATGEPLVAKVDSSGSGTLDVEGRMLLDLDGFLPVPEVVHSESDLLLMEWVEGSSAFDASSERHAAELLYDLHGHYFDHHGFEHDTLIGGVRQPNVWRDSWVEFFAEFRLRHMADDAFRHGRLPARLRDRVFAFADDLGEFVPEPGWRALLHGDVWSGNVLAKNGRITAFLDPAVYIGNLETELAFITLFSTFGDEFFAAYSAADESLLDKGFFTERRHVHNLYPLLVHVRLFGGSYVASVEATLSRFGY